ncbi:MAG: T9SS type A sorting domain-containing protein [Sphingobacteriales bacterium]|nr:MAG: T9SS type A sorting domain-containing protein [Sphingobacteriales bacterium]
MIVFFKQLRILTALLLTPSLLPAQTLDPYLQAITPSSVGVNWKMATGGTPIVRYGTSITNLTTTVPGTTDTMTDVGYSNNYFYHTVKLRGLQPATKYYYRIVSATDSSTVHSFRTLPTPGAAPNAGGRLRFLILGDNQIKAQPRYDSLMVAARRKLLELYGPDYNDSVSFLLNMGDQVDVGTLDHYEYVHLKKSRYLSGELPIQTAVGNHETYGTLKMEAYYRHFLLDSMQYKGIYSGSEDYYSFQAGNVVIAYLNTENTSTTQFNWIKRVIDSANADPAVKWIVTIAHRPYQAEQYVGDISPWIRNTVVPYCMTSPKFVLHVGAHHHLYARGQMKDVPAYNVISGGTAWDQYWGMATEQNFDDVQKTISNWAYQLVDVDMVSQKFNVTTYSIGSVYGLKNNVVIDSFHHYAGLPAPAKPSITNAFPDSLQLPLTLSGSAFQTASSELLNSTEFQVALDRNFSVVEKSSYRHYEDLFGKVVGQNPDTTADVNLGVDITQYTIASGALPNGRHYVRVRHRDRNLNWSAWSNTDSFKVYNSVVVNPALALDTTHYRIGDTVRVTFSNGPTNAQAWIGIYKRDKTGNQYTKFEYTNGTNGIKKYVLTDADEYYVAYFGDNGYTNEVAPRKAFYYGPAVTLSSDSTGYRKTDSIRIAFSNAPTLTNDWIGVYKVGMTPGTGTGTSPSVIWSYKTGTSGKVVMKPLAKGYYFATYLIRDKWFEASPRVYFSVGDTITTLTTNKTIYNLGEYISATWVDGPGNPKDWLGVYHQGDNPNIDPLISYTYINGLPAGARNLPDTAMPRQPGNYFVVLFTNDSYNEVSNRVSFQMLNGQALASNLLQFSGTVAGAANLLHWENAETGTVVAYELQHSTDGKTFGSLYRTAPQPALNGSYAYQHETPADGQNYYRLQLTAPDGKTTFSETIQIHRNETGQNTVSVYPNPAVAGSHSIIESPYPIDQIDVLDATGQMIYQSKNINNNRFSLLHQDLPPGTYLIRIHSRKLYTAKLVIQ